MRERRRLLAIVLVLVATATVARAELDSAAWRKISDLAEQSVKRNDREGATHAIRACAKDDSERAVKLISTTWAKFPGEDYALEDAVANALEALKSEKAVAQLRKELTTSKDGRLKALIVDLLGSRGGKKEEPAFIPLLEDKSESLVRGVVRQLARFRSEAGIRAMCNAMEKLEAKGNTAATWQDMRHALTRALGVELQGGADYRNYLDANKERFVAGKGIPAPEGKEGAAGGGSGRSGETVVFGTELYCKNVVIILDTSGSMDHFDPYPPGFDPGSVPREYVESGGIKDPSRNRMFRAKKAIQSLLDELAKAKGKVNLVDYGTSPSSWREKDLHELNTANLSSLKKYVEELKPDGVTCTDRAFVTAFEIAPQADCFYLISDGKATHDGTNFIPAEKILDEVEKLNRVRKVQINTFGFIPPKGSRLEGADVPLMQGLAEKSGGTYTEIR